MTFAITTLTAALATASTSSGTRDETIVLDAPERRITLTPYDTSLEIRHDDGALRVAVGASVHAERIVATLRIIAGTVRFHGDLSRLDAAVSRHTTHP